MKKGKGYRFKKADANSYVFGKLANMKKAPPAEAGVQPKQDVLAAMMAGMTGNANGDNCGTGAGGFKKGNTCASGREVANDIDDLASKLKMSSFDPGKKRVYGSSSVLVGSNEQARAILARSVKTLRAMGFSPADGFGYNQTEDSIRYEHPHGHVFTQIIYEPSSWGTTAGQREVESRLVFVPKDNREGMALSTEAQEATRRAVEAFTHPQLGGMLGQTALNTASIAVQQLLQEEQYKGARASHKEAIHLLNRLKESTGANPRVKKLIDDAIAAHGIANDWYMEKMGVQNAAGNCGTGAGGFKKGNTCAKGGRLADNIEELAGVLNLPGKGVRGVRSVNQSSYKTKHYTNYSFVMEDRASAGKLSASVKKILNNLGFTIDENHLNDNKYTIYEHPEGHQVGVGFDTFVSGRDGSSFSTVSVDAKYIPSHKKEGVLLSMEARDATKKLLGWNRRGSLDLSNGNYTEARRAVSTARDFNHAAAVRIHAEMAKYHQGQANTFGQSSDAHSRDLSKKHKDAAIAHGIAMDWHLENEHVANAKGGDNCGTGKGGFKKGNTCAKGSNLDETDWRSMVTSLGINPARFTRLIGGNYTNSKNTVAIHSAGDPAHDGNLSPSELSDRLHKSYNSIIEKLTNAGFKRDPKGNNIWEYYYHPSGHEIEFHLERVREGQLYDSRYQDNSSRLIQYTGVLHFVPKENREGVAISREALEASWKATGFRDAKEAKEAAVRGDLAMARRRHEFAEAYHRQQAQYHAHNPYTVKMENEAADLHAIARDWYMQKLGVQNRGVWNNCGTGAGGFKKGNTCASGDGEVADSFSDLKDKLGLGNGKFYKFRSTETAGYTTQDHTSHAVAKMEHDRVTRLVTKMGFKAISKTEGRLNGGIATRYEHPHGHRLDVGLSSDDKAYTWVQIEFVPKKFREALSLAEAAQAASVLATPDSEIPAVQAVTYTRYGQSKEAINQHKFMMDYHGRGLQYVKDPEVRKQHERAVTAHSIARDWHMDNLGVTNGKWKPVQRS